MTSNDLLSLPWVQADPRLVGIIEECQDLDRFNKLPRAMLALYIGYLLGALQAAHEEPH